MIVYVLSLGNTSVFKKYDTSASGQDGITGIGFLLLPEIMKTKTKCIKEWIFRFGHHAAHEGNCWQGNKWVSRCQKWGERTTLQCISRTFMKWDHEKVISFYSTKSLIHIREESSLSWGPGWITCGPSFQWDILVHRCACADGDRWWIGLQHALICVVKEKDLHILIYRISLGKRRKWHVGGCGQGIALGN